MTHKICCVCDVQTGMRCSDRESLVRSLLAIRKQVGFFKKQKIQTISLCGSISSMYDFTWINNLTVFVLLSLPRQQGNLPSVCGPDTGLVGTI